MIHSPLLDIVEKTKRHRRTKAEMQRIEGKTKLLPKRLTDSPKPAKIFEEPFELDIPPINELSLEGVDVK